VEAVFDRIDGVYKTTSGYTGGHVPEPTYEQVISKDTGHAEAVRIQYDPTVVSYEELLRWFWEAHDPTTLNRQGADVGPQYRSAIFVHSPEQRQIAEQSKAAAQKHFDDPIVTEVTDAGEFYAAEGYHQDYYDNNRSAGYCRYVITPKLEKLDLAK
jgi:peptide-methionine (S)-S-oxide reductase